MMKAPLLTALAALTLAGCATTEMASDQASAPIAAPAPAPMFVPVPAVVLPADARGTAARPRYALVAAPTLPCAPGYCPAPVVRAPRADRN